MVNIQMWTFLAMSEKKNGHGKKSHEKLLKMFFVELMFEYLTGGVWGRPFCGDFIVH